MTCLKTQGATAEVGKIFENIAQEVFRFASYPSRYSRLKVYIYT